MKLKLEMQQGVAVLSVLESVAVQDVAILRAGLNKLFQSGQKAIVLDLAQLPQGSIGEGAAAQISQLPGLAPSLECQIVIASPVASLGQAPDRDQAIALLGSPLAKLLAQEARVGSQVQALQGRKAQAEKQLADANREGDMKALLREHSQLKAQVENLESQLKLLLKNRKEPFTPSDDARKKRQILSDTVISILRERNMVPARGDK